VAFVGSTGQDTENQVGDITSKSNKIRQRHPVWPSSGDCYSDVGDDHSLCDKDCGWCGHCADNVYF
jgi:hypothetical protein